MRSHRGMLDIEDANGIQVQDIKMPRRIGGTLHRHRERERGRWEKSEKGRATGNEPFAKLSLTCQTVSWLVLLLLARWDFIECGEDNKISYVLLESSRLPEVGAGFSDSRAQKQIEGHVLRRYCRRKSGNWVGRSLDMTLHINREGKAYGEVRV